MLLSVLDLQQTLTRSQATSHYLLPGERMDRANVVVVTIKYQSADVLVYGRSKYSRRRRFSCRLHRRALSGGCAQRCNLVADDASEIVPPVHSI